MARAARKQAGMTIDMACRLHVIRDVRKSVFTLRIAGFHGDRLGAGESALAPSANDQRASLPIRRAQQIACCMKIVRALCPRPNFAAIREAKTARGMIAPVLQSKIG